MDPDSHLPNNDNPTDLDQDFQAIGSVLRILQLNVEGLSAAKRCVIRSFAERQKIDIIGLQETHVNVGKASHFSIRGFDLVCYALHSKNGRETYVRTDITDAAHIVLTSHCDAVRVGGFHIVNICKPPSKSWAEASIP